MKRRTKIILFFLIAVLILFGFLAATGLYYYRNPESVKPFLESTVSRMAGASFTIEDLSYSLEPLQVRAQGIRLTPGEGLRGVSLDIPSFVADMDLEGPFSHRRLIFKVLKVNGFSLDVSHDLSLPELRRGKQGSSWISDILGRLVALLVFRDLEFRAAEISDGRISGRTADQTLELTGIRADLTPDHLIEIACNARLNWPSRDMHLIAPDVRITTDQSLSLRDTEIKGRVSAPGITLKSPALDIPAMDCSAQLAFQRDPQILSFTPLEIVLKKAVLKEAFPGPLPGLDLSLKTDGRIVLRDLEAEVSSFHLTLGELLDASGRLKAAAGPRPGVALDLDTCRIVPEQWIPLLPDRIQTTLKPVAFSGPLSLKGRLRGEVDGNKVDLNCDLGVQMDKNSFSFEMQGIRLSGEVTSDIRVSGAVPDLKARGRIDLEKALVHGKEILTKPFSAGLNLDFQSPLVKIGELEINVPGIDVGTGKGARTVKDVELCMPEGTYDMKEGKLVIPGAVLDTSLLKNLEVTFQMNRDEKTVTLEGKDVRLIETADTLGLLPPGWRFKGTEALEAGAVQDRDGNWTISAGLDLGELALENGDGTIMGEGLLIKTRMEGRLNHDFSQMEAGGGLSLGEGEILFDRFYFNLKENSFSADYAGVYDLSRKTLQVSRLNAGLKNILTLSLEGMLTRGPDGTRGRLALHIPGTPLIPLFRHFLTEPFKMEKPLLANLEVGGMLGADLDLAFHGNHRTARGHWQWDQGRIASEDKGFSLRDIDLRLPVWYRSGAGEAAEKSLKGTLSIGSVEVPLLPVQPLNLVLEAGPNNLAFREAIRIQVPGGEIGLGGVAVSRLFQNAPVVETNVDFGDIDLNPLLSGIWDRPVQGTVTGKLESIRYSGDELTTRGGIRAKVFGGEISLSDFRAGGIASSTPLFHLNAAWNELNLKEITKETPFGKVEGIMSGYVRDLEIAFGQPQRFDLLLETVETKGIRQRISATAVDNISQISGGPSPFIGISGQIVKTFLRDFPYDDIGMHVTLKNDCFRIQGTAKKEDPRYLVTKKAGILGVEILNNNPDKCIPFDKMVKKIKGIKLRGRPVIK